VQISPVLNNEAEFETGLQDSQGNFLTLSSAAVDASGYPIAAILKIKASGARDLTYGGFGSVVPTTPPTAMASASLAIDGSDNAVIGMIGGDLGSIVLTRYTSAGLLDASYGTAGSLTIPFPQGVAPGPFNMKAATDGTVFIVGSAINPNGIGPWQPIVIKVTPAGALDPYFLSSAPAVAGSSTPGINFFYAGSGGPTGRATDLHIDEADGTLLVGGRVGDNRTYNQFFVARMSLASGALDASFGNSGMTIVSFGNVVADGRKMAVDSLGRIVLVGPILANNLPPNPPPASGSGIIRLTPKGALDKNFGNNGILQLNTLFIQIVEVQPNNKILLAGSAPETAPTAIIGRLLPNGQFDLAFGGTGIVPLVIPGTVANWIAHLNYLPSGKIIVHAQGGGDGLTQAAGYLVRVDSGSGQGCH